MEERKTYKIEGKMLLVVIPIFRAKFPMNIRVEHAFGAIHMLASGTEEELVPIFELCDKYDLIYEEIAA